MRFFLLLILGGLMHAMRSFTSTAPLGNTPTGVTAAFGFLLLTAYIVGDFFKRVGLPRITGYLLTGIVVGPSLLNLVTETMVVNLRVFNGVAVALIALSAGAELEIRRFTPLLRTIGWIIAIPIVGTAALLAIAVYLLSPMIPAMSTLIPAQTIAMSLVLAIAMTAQSPAVVIALLGETKARGPLAKTVIGVVVLSDIAIIVLFAVASSLAQGTFGERPDVIATALSLGGEIFGSAFAGLLIGVLAGIFLRKAPEGGPLFLVLLGFVVAEVGQRIHLDPLLTALAVGIYIRNMTDAADRMHHDLERAALPVYVAFFSVAGATVRPDVLMLVGIPAAIFVLIRAAGFLAGTRVATRLAGAPDVVRRYAGYGLLPQSGLALAIALLIRRTFEIGPEISTLVFAVVLLNELTAPTIFKRALVNSGEAEPEEALVENMPQPAAAK